LNYDLIKLKKKYLINGVKMMIWFVK